MCYGYGLLAQPGRTIKVKAGEDIAQAYSPQGFYRFGQFGKTKLYFKDGNHNYGQRFNYNILFGTFQFISPKGDTLDLVGGEEKIESLVIDGITFLYNDGWIEISAMSNSIALLKKIIIKTSVENLGAFDLPNSSVSILGINRYFSGIGVHNLVLNQDVIVMEHISLFWMDKNHKIVKATKSNLLKMLPATSQAKTETYLKQNKVNFDNEAELKELMEAIAKQEFKFSVS
jgi:hypothetical protein